MEEGVDGQPLLGLWRLVGVEFGDASLALGEGGAVDDAGQEGGEIGREGGGAGRARGWHCARAGRAGWSRSRGRDGGGRRRGPGRDARRGRRSRRRWARSPGGWSRWEEARRGGRGWTAGAHGRWCPPAWARRR